MSHNLTFSDFKPDDRRFSDLINELSRVAQDAGLRNDGYVSFFTVLDALEVLDDVACTLTELRG